MRRSGLFILAFSFQILCHAQAPELPVLAKDPAVKVSVLSNGITCYLVPGSSEKGLIRFSLVQKKDPSLELNSLLVEARECFSSVEIGKGTALSDFLPRNGFAPSRLSYVAPRQGAIIYNFNSYSSARGEAVLDSTLLGIMSLADRLASRGNATTDQALIAVGDFDAGTMQSKLKLFSMFCSEREGRVPEYFYRWNPEYKGSISFATNGLPGVKVQWRASRIPEKYLNTVFPAVSKVMAGEFSKVLANRLYPAFLAEGLNVWINVVHRNGDEGLGDESITLTVYCARSLRQRVKEILRQELDRLLTWGVDEIEYTYARDGYRNEWLASSRNFHRDDRMYMSKCKSAFLYGANIALAEDAIKFAYRDMPDSVSTRSFNRYMRRMLQQTSKPDSSLAVASSFQSRDYIESVLEAYKPAVALSVKKMKDRTEYVSGGLFWTLPNGVNIVYRKMDTKGISYFTYAVRGGRQHADSDYLSCIDNVYEESYNNYLSSQGIDMKIRLFPSDVRISGHVPDGNLEKLLLVLSALSAQKENVDVFGPCTYKLFVLASDMEETEIKTLFGKYALGLRPGGKWMPCEAVESEDEYTLPAEYSSVEFISHLDISAANKAKTDVAHCCLDDALSVALTPYAAASVLNTAFVGFPTDKYRVTIGIGNLPVQNFAITQQFLKEEDAMSVMRDAVYSLSRQEIGKDRLDIYKKEAKNAFASYKSTPEYYIDAVCNRYLDNRDLMSRYDFEVDAVSASDLKAFFQSLEVRNVSSD